MPVIPFYDLAGLHRELSPQIQEALTRVVSANQFVLGPEVEAFEREFSAYCGVTHGVGVGNGLDALHLSLRALGIGPGDEVIVPGQTFIATWLAVSAAGASPVAVDVSLETGQIDPDTVAAAVTPRTAAVIAVHLFGSMAPMRELRAVCSRAGIALVEDAAQAHGAALDGIRAGGWSDVAAFSFYPGKNLGGLGDGGMAVTSSADLAARLRLLRNYGSRRKYHHEQQGINSRLDEIQAAVLRVKLPHLDGWNQQRRERAARYRATLADLADADTTAEVNGCMSAAHLYPIRVRNRTEVICQLERNGIEVGVHYPTAPADSPAYRDVIDGNALPNSRLWAQEEISLPMGPLLALEAVDQVVEALGTALRTPVETR